MTTAQFAEALRVLEVSYSCKVYRRSNGGIRMIVDTQYPQDRGRVIALALDHGLEAMTVPGALGAHRPNVRVSIDGLTFWEN